MQPMTFGFQAAGLSFHKLFGYMLFGNSSSSRFYQASKFL